MSTPEFSSARIVIVDDQANVALLERALEQWGYRNVAATTNFSHALGLCRQSEPDLVLLDLMMPRPDGFELLRALTDHSGAGNYLPILVLTGNVSKDAKTRALKLGAKDFLHKPLDLSDVRLRVAALLETRRLHLLQRDPHEIQHSPQPPTGEGDPAEAAAPAVRDADGATDDLDRTHSDADERAAAVDQTAAEADQQGSDADQATADREYQRTRGNLALAGEDAYETSRTQRAKTTAGRQATAAIRASNAQARTGTTADRDRVAAEDAGLRRIAREVERERALLTQAEELANAGSWELDLRENSLTWSAGMYRIRGVTPGTRPLNLEIATLDLHPDDRVRVITELVSPKAGEDNLRSAYRIVRPDGTLRYLETCARVQRDTHGVPVRILGASVDISERRGIEAELAVAQKNAETAKNAAEHANLAKSEFLSRISHELRTPMNAVLGFAQLLAMEDLLPRQRESVEQILRGGAHLLALIDEVLDIAQIESGTSSLSLEPIDLASALGDAMELIAPVAAQRDVTLILELDPAREIYVIADRQRLRQVILNLLSNAVKYNHEGGQVRLTVTLSAAARVLIAVADTGRGLDSAKFARLFEPFDRLDAEQTAVQGTGLGLAVSRSLAEQMNGSLTVASELGRGSVFTLELDRAENPVRSDTLSAARQTGRDGASWGGRTRLLYIEDNPSNFRLVEQLFIGRPEVRVMSAQQGGVGLELARAHHPDLILLDLHLPDIAGAAVLNQLQADPATRAIPVLVLSADATHREMRRLRKAGARGFLAKPLDLPELLAAISKNLPAGKSPR